MAEFPEWNITNETIENLWREHDLFYEQRLLHEEMLRRLAELDDDKLGSPNTLSRICEEAENRQEQQKREEEMRRLLLELEDNATSNNLMRLCEKMEKKYISQEMEEEKKNFERDVERMGFDHFFGAFPTQQIHAGEGMSKEVIEEREDAASVIRKVYKSWEYWYSSSEEEN